MPRYVDGFVIAIPKKNVKAYLRLARLGARVWKKYGALEYRECIAEDLKAQFGVGFQGLIRLKPTETVVFSWIVYRSRAHRDRVNAKVMKDAEMSPEDMGSMPFDARRFAMAGFEELVAAHSP